MMGRAKPKLLVLTSTLPRWEKDAEPRFVLDLAKALSDRFEPVILAPMATGCRRSGMLEGVRVERFRYAPHRWQQLAAPGAIMPNLRARPWLYALVPLFIAAQILALALLLRRERFDAVHCHWLVPQGLALAVAKSFVRVPPTLLTCHGADAFTLNRGPMPALKRWILGRVDGVTVVSREIGQQVGRYLAKGPAHIPMGVDVRRFAKAGEARKSGPPTILFIGRLAEKKGLDRLLRCMADARFRIRGARLRVVGEGPLRTQLERLALELGIGDRVDFIGPLPHERLAGEMGRALLFCAPFVVAPDGDREGTPTVLLEAAAAGIPIVTTDVGGCGDIVANGRSGWLVEPGNEAALTQALVAALDNPKLAQSMAEQARRGAENHGWPVIADRYVEALLAVEAKPLVSDCDRGGVGTRLRSLLESPAGRWIGGAGSAICLGVFLLLLGRAFSAGETRELLSGSWAALAAALLLYLLTYGPMVIAWSVLAEACGCRPTRVELARIFLVSQLAKYLPGNVGQFIGRAYAGERRGFRIASLTKAMALEVGGVLVASAILSALAMSLGVVSQSEAGRPSLFFAPALALVTCGGLFGSALLFRDGKGKKSLLKPSLVAVCCYVLVLVMVASANVLLVGANSGQWSWPIALSTAAAFLVSWLAGFITPGAPAGLGIRELAFCSLLAGIVPTHALVLSAAGFRLVTTVGDLIAWAVGMLLPDPGRRAPVAELPV